MRRLELNEAEAKTLGYFLKCHLTPGSWPFTICLDEWNEAERFHLSNIRHKLARVVQVTKGVEMKAVRHD